MKEARREKINGVHALRYPDNSWYVDVAERVRLVHQTHTPFSFERGEICQIRQVWFYRAEITISEQHYIGDAEIHFGAPIDTPDGTNPISCGQTSALGNALTFAGFGDLRTLLERLGDPLTDEAIERSPDAPTQTMQGIDVVMLDGFPYVPVVERIRHLHRMGTSFALEACEIHDYNGVWIYRATVLIGGKRFVGDAEIFFDAAPASIDGRYPISCGQTSAVGNALAFAGFGDVHSLLERQGKRTDDLSLTPSLASADAVMRAKRSAAAQGVPHGKPPRTHSQNGSASHSPAASREKTAGVQSKRQEPLPTRITPVQRERLRILCERLGESEPATIEEMTEVEAEQLLTRLRSQEEELFQTLDDALQQEQAETESPTSVNEVASYAEVGALKTAWMRAYHVKGEASSVRQQWRQFKQQICHHEVPDDTMARTEYHRLMHAIEHYTQNAGQEQMSTLTGNAQ